MLNWKVLVTLVGAYILLYTSVFRGSDIIRTRRAEDDVMVEKLTSIYGHTQKQGHMTTESKSKKVVKNK